jgi:hypothetical protein
MKAAPEIKDAGRINVRTTNFLSTKRFTRLLHTVSEIRDATNLEKSSCTALLIPSDFCGYPKE